jgi:hypothetical protein
LRHETINNAVERQPIVKTLFRQARDLFDVFWSQVWAQRDDNVTSLAFVVVHGHCECFGHVIFPILCSDLGA